MFRQFFAAVLATLMLLASPYASALAFRSVKETGAVMYEAPALSAKKLFVVSRYYPVEVLSTQGEWSRVRDATGSIAWMPSAVLSSGRTLLVVVPRADIRAKADPKADVVFSVPRNGVLQLVTAPVNDWVSVRHRDGSTGFARITDLWGL